MTANGVFVHDAGYWPEWYKRKANVSPQSYRSRGVQADDFLHGGSKASTGLCVAWDSLEAVKGYRVTYPPIWTLNPTGGIPALWQSSHRYGISSPGRRIVSSVVRVRRLQQSASRDKGMLLFKRTVCQYNGEGPWSCEVFKMSKCFRCTDTQYMHQTKTKNTWRSYEKEMDPGRVVFADKIFKNGEYSRITYPQRLKERANFAKCAKALMAAHPDGNLPDQNKCSFYCHSTTPGKAYTDINSNYARCSSLPRAKTGASSSSPEWYTSNSVYDESVAARLQTMML